MAVPATVSIERAAGRGGGVPGHGKARIQDVATAAGVSIGTVSRVLNNDKTLSIRESTRNKIIAVSNQLDYVPNSSAIALRRQKTDTIGLVLDDVTNPVFSEIIAGVHAECTLRDFNLVLLDAKDSARMMTGLVKNRYLDGLIVQSGYGLKDADLAKFSETVPTVLLNGPGIGGVPGVFLEEDVASEIATEYFLTERYSSVAFIGGSPGPSEDMRIEGFNRAIRNATKTGARTAATVIRTDGWRAVDGTQAIAELLAGGDSYPEAIVIANNGLAVGAMSALADRGISIPHDVSVIAIQDTWLSEFLVPHLSTVRLGLRQLGKVVVRQLVDVISGEAVEDHVVKDPKPRLILRSSTR